MTNKELKIVFMGTPEFAVPTLERITEEEFNVVAVITAPDKPQGRGKMLGTSPVKDFAVAKNIPLLQPTNLKDPEFLAALKAYDADLQVIVAFRMLPEVVWNMPPLGSINLHGSLLPDYRGAAPIHRAIINGEKETGVTTFKLKHEIDTGNILFQEKEPIHYDDTAGTLYDRLMHKGAELIVRTIRAIQNDDYALRPQTITGEPKQAPKIFREDCKINWHQPAEQVRNFIRGLSPYPAAWTLLDNKTVKIFRAEKAHNTYGDQPGSFKSDGKNYLEVVTIDGALAVQEIQQEGKKRLKTEDFLKGYKVNKT